MRLLVQRKRTLSSFYELQISPVPFPSQETWSSVIGTGGCCKVGLGPGASSLNLGKPHLTKWLSVSPPRICPRGRSYLDYTGPKEICFLPWREIPLSSSECISFRNIVANIVQDKSSHKMYRNTMENQLSTGKSIIVTMGRLKV